MRLPRIRRCPHCHHRGRLMDGGNWISKYRWYYVRCTHCHLSGPKLRIEYEAKLIWNQICFGAKGCKKEAKK